MRCLYFESRKRENAKTFLRENPETFKKIEERVRKDLGLIRDVEVATV